MASVKLISQCLRLILTDIYCRAHNSVSSGRTPLHIIVYTTRVSGVGLQVRRGSDSIVNPGFLREVREPQVEQRQVWVNTNSTDAQSLNITSVPQCHRHHRPFLVPDQSLSCFWRCFQVHVGQSESTTRLRDLLACLLVGPPPFVASVARSLYQFNLRPNHFFFQNENSLKNNNFWKKKKRIYVDVNWNQNQNTVICVLLI